MITLISSKKLMGCSNMRHPVQIAYCFSWAWSFLTLIHKTIDIQGVSYYYTHPNFLLEIRVIIRIESNSCYLRIYETFFQNIGEGAGPPRTPCCAPPDRFNVTVLPQFLQLWGRPSSWTQRSIIFPNCFCYHKYRRAHFVTFCSIHILNPQCIYFKFAFCVFILL